MLQNPSRKDKKKPFSQVKQVRIIDIPYFSAKVFRKNCNISDRRKLYYDNRFS